MIVDVVSGDLWLQGQPAGNLVDKYQGGAGVRGLAWMVEERLDRGNGATLPVPVAAGCSPPR